MGNSVSLGVVIAAGSSDATIRVYGLMFFIVASLAVAGVAAWVADRKARSRTSNDFGLAGGDDAVGLPGPVGDVAPTPLAPDVIDAMASVQEESIFGSVGNVFEQLSPLPPRVQQSKGIPTKRGVLPKRPSSGGQPSGRTKETFDE
jgi:hypothetical protein